MIKNEVNINEQVVVDYVIPESVFDKKRTKTSHFLLNTVFANTSIMTTEYFVNAFLDDMDFKHRIARPLFVLFKMKPKDNRWNLLHTRLRAKSEYILEYFVGTQNGYNLIMFVFQVPEKLGKEYIFFKAGKYSQFSEAYKKTFARYTHNDKAQPVESTIYRVLYKSKELKKELETYFGDSVKFEPEDELWGMPENKYEVYRYDETRKG